MKRIYEAAIQENLRENRQMAMIIGPRQVGKTTSARTCAAEHRYYTWDRQTDRALITRGADAVAGDLGLDSLRSGPATVVFDEIHKYRKWKTFLKGFFDVHGEATRILVTGSSRLGFLRRGGDSLMGRYFPYRMHPVSVAELSRAEPAAGPISLPVRPEPGTLDRLLAFGGFPEPLLRGETRFYSRWRRLRGEQLFREDLRDLALVHEVGQVQVLAELVAGRVGSQVNRTSLAEAVNVSVDTATRWISLLEGLYHCFAVRPWFANVPKSLRKQPKLYLWDWSLVADAGARRENLVASHLLKAVHFWTDTGLGDFELRYLRDKAGREVDFVVVRDGRPWFLVEVKSSAGRGVSPALGYFRERTGAAHAFQAAFDMDWIERDCFAEPGPIRVPITTLLSQLV
jgi:hypothetical protein